MRKLFNLILIGMIILASTVKVDARTLPVNDVKLNIAKQSVAQIQKLIDGEIQVSVMSLPFNELNLPDGKVSYKVQLMQEIFMQITIVRVVVSVNGQEEKVFNAPISVKNYKNVLVAARDISRDESINPSSVKIERRDCSNNMEYTLSDNFLNKDIVAKKFYKSGETIDKRFVRLRPDVQRNTEVQAYFSTNGLMISISAIAVGEGMIGDYVAVQSRDYKKVYRAKIVGVNKVMVNM